MDLLRIIQAEDKLKEAIKLLQEVLGEIEEGDPEGGEDDPEGNAGAKDRKGSNPKKEALLDFIKNI